MAFNAKEWKPTKPQSDFLRLPWSIKEAFFGGAAGGGKSDLLLVLPLVLGLYTKSQFKQLFTRRTYKELKLEIVPRSRELYPKFGATFNQSDMAWTFPREDQFGSGARNSGANIFLGHCEHESDVHNYDSMEINLFTPDELTSFTEYMYLYIALTRVRTSDPTLPAIIRGAGMPGDIGHKFVYERFVKPAPEGGVILRSERSGLKRIYIHASFDDNPHIDPTYRQSIEELPEAERRAKKGDWTSFEGQVFDEFRDKRYPDEPENALHVIEPFEIPEWWPRIVVGDWGYAAMTWIGFAAIAPNGRVFVYRELTFIKTKIAQWAPILKEFIDQENVKLVRFCKSAGQDRGQEHTIQQQIEEHLGRTIELTENRAGSRVAGKMLLHEYFRWQPKPKPPKDTELVYSEEVALRIYRLKGQSEYERYLKQFDTEEVEEILPKMMFFNTCPVVIEAIKICVYDPKKPEDIAEFSGDDPVDGIRYLADAADAYVKVAQQEMAIVHKREQYTQLLNNSQDYTGFYRNMRKLDNSGLPKPVARYRR